MTLVPTLDWCIIERDATEDVSQGGIVLPDVAKDRPNKGTVLAVGPGRIASNGERIEVGFSPGRTVLFTKYAGEEFKVDGKKLLLVKEENVLAIIK
ncbi:MAG: co-chaperone GroES [Candidatus Pacebacteria bacterium]|nr:co-chaperone GroES [Candidatus Paceibacterota bacterium]